MASFARQIPAGGRDKISILVHTSGSGGETIQKRFKVSTNDPQTPQVELLVSGKVGALITVSPPQVRLAGRVGEQLSAQVRLQPATDQTFTITEAKPWQGKEIGLEVKPLGQDPSREGYLLTVRSTRTDPGIYRDYIVIRTDMKQKPNLNIPVYIRIYPPGQGGPVSPAPQ